MNETFSGYHYQWSDLAFGSKKPLKELQSIFIAAPRELSPQRFTQLIKTYLPQGNLLIGLAEENYVEGFEGQPQFRTLQLAAIEKIIAKVNASDAPHKLYTLTYAQRDLRYLLEKLDFKKVVLINGSWRYAFHTLEPYYVLAQKHIPYDMVSPFADEDEAQAYEKHVFNEIEVGNPLPVLGSGCTEVEMMHAAQTIARYSYDYNFQTGVSLGKEAGKENTYTFLAGAWNKVVPYQTYAMHHGAARERHFSPPHDLNHYDTVHAEVVLIIKAVGEGINLQGTTLFINLLPCPPCSRMLVETPIREFVYESDHSNGYAVKMLTSAGKTVRRLIL